MELFMLKAKWTEEYDCPDNGPVEVCDTFDIIAIAESREPLDLIADELRKGYHNNYWSSKRCHELRALYPEFDNFRETEYVVEDITDFFIVGSD